MRGHWRGAPMESLEIVDLTFFRCLKNPAGWGSGTPLLATSLSLAQLNMLGATLGLEAQLVLQTASGEMIPLSAWLSAVQRPSSPHRVHLHCCMLPRQC